MVLAVANICQGFWQMALLSDTVRLSHRADVQLSTQSVTWLADESMMFVARGVR